MARTPPGPGLWKFGPQPAELEMIRLQPFANDIWVCLDSKLAYYNIYINILQYYPKNLRCSLGSIIEISECMSI